MEFNFACISTSLHQYVIAPFQQSSTALKKNSFINPDAFRAHKTNRKK